MQTLTAQQQLINSPTFLPWATGIALWLGFTDADNLLHYDAGRGVLLLRCPTTYRGADIEQIRAALTALTPEPVHRITRPMASEYRVYPDGSLSLQSNGEESCWWDAVAFIQHLERESAFADWDTATQELATYLGMADDAPF
jgi:hypothetical protein